MEIHENYYNDYKELLQKLSTVLDEIYNEADFDVKNLENSISNYVNIEGGTSEEWISLARNTQTFCNDILIFIKAIQLRINAFVNAYRVISRKLKGFSDEMN